MAFLSPAFPRLHAHLCARLERNQRLLLWTEATIADKIDKAKESVCGVFMAKSLLVLMLMATQLLAGSGGSLYVCISHDGSFCGLDSGPESCKCAGDHDHQPSDGCRDSHCHHKSEICDEVDGHENDEAFSPLEFLDRDGCGCTHIPLMLSSDRPIRFVRTSLMTQSEPLGFVVALLPFWNCASPSEALLANCRWNGPPVVCDFTLMAISTIIIRC